MLKLRLATYARARFEAVGQPGRKEMHVSLQCSLGLDRYTREVTCIFAAQLTRSHRFAELPLPSCPSHVWAAAVAKTVRKERWKNEWVWCEGRVINVISTSKVLLSTTCWSAHIHAHTHTIWTPPRRCPPWSAWARMRLRAVACPACGWARVRRLLAVVKQEERSSNNSRGIGKVGVRNQ